MTTFTHRGRHIRYVPIDRDHTEALEAWRRRRALRERQRREAVRRRLFLFLAVLVGMMVGATIARASGPRRGTTPARSTAFVGVRPGDTVWSVAARHGDPTLPMAVRVRRIQDLNERDLSFMVPGQLIRIPGGPSSASVPDRKFARP